MVIFFAHQAIFQLTPSRRVTLKLSKGGRLTIISTHALTEGDADIFCRFLRQKISTHALTEGDLGQSFHRCCRSCISTHALTEGDKLLILPYFCPPFQLTPSRRATVTYGDMSVSVPVFQLTPSRRATKISAYSPDSLIFQLTPSRRATMKS